MKKKLLMTFFISLNLYAFENQIKKFEILTSPGKTQVAKLEPIYYPYDLKDCNDSYHLYIFKGKYPVLKVNNLKYIAKSIKYKCDSKNLITSYFIHFYNKKFNERVVLSKTEKADKAYQESLSWKKELYYLDVLERY